MISDDALTIYELVAHEIQELPRDQAIMLLHSLHLLVRPEPSPTKHAAEPHKGDET